jgi:hypothetical protein
LLGGVAAVARLGIKTSRSTCPYLHFELNGLPVGGLVDTGSVRSLIGGGLYKQLADKGLIRAHIPETIQCRTAANTPLEITHSVLLKVKIEGFTWQWKFLVAKDLAVSLILGADFVAKSGLVLDLHSGHAFFKFRRHVKVPLHESNTPVNLVLGEQPTGELPIRENQISPQGQFDHLPPRQRKLLQDFCARFPDVLTKKLGVTKLIEYEIRLNDTRPVRSHPYQLAPPKMAILKEMIKELLENGVIEPSNSTYSSPAFLVPKPNGKSRMVIDYRKLNQKIEIDPVPLPVLHSAFDWFGDAEYFTVIDLNQAYHQIPLKEESKDITSFCTPWNLYRFTRVPFGISVGAQTLTRLLDSIFHDLKFRYLFNYLDDVVVYSKTFEEHMTHLQEVFTRLQKAGLTCNPEKVKFAQREISFLGHLVSSRGVRIDPERTQSIRDFPPPRDAKGIARFVGMVNFYRKFIPNVAQLALPLNELRRKGAKFAWGEAQQKAFEALKEAIAQPPVLRMADFSRPFILQTDASSAAIGAVLSQEFDGYRQPIAFASRTLTHAERKASSIYELECLAVVFGVDKFRRYLEHAQFLLETDNQALSWLLAHPRQLGKIGRWVVKLSSFKFTVQHVKGTQNVVADTLSRMFHHTDETTVEEKQEIVGSILEDFPLAFEGILKHQKEDPELGPILQDIEAGRERNPYFCSKGVLCCKRRNQTGSKIVLPSILVPMAFSYFHSSTVGGHVGIYKTIQKIRQNFIWKGMDRDIAERVRNCVLCGLSKPAQNTKVGLLASEVASRPMEKVFADYVGPLPRTREGNTFLLVCIDAFTKFTWLFPLRRATAKTTIHALQNRLFQHFGVPCTLVTDNGAQWRAREFHRMCFGAGIQHVTTSPYYPQPSHAERFNRNLKSALIAFHAQSQDRWDENLKWLQMAFNSAQHEGHKAIPYELMFGKAPNNPLSNLWTLSDLLPTEANVDVTKNWEAAKRNLLVAHRKLRRRYNQGRKDNPYRTGDLVFCKTHPQSSAGERRAAKLCYRWSGPYQILRFLTPVTVLLGYADTGKPWRRSHITQLKPFRSNSTGKEHCPEDVGGDSEAGDT